MRVVEADLVAGRARASVAGRPVDVFAYNGAFPGPLLRFREGDRVRVRLANRLGEPTNLHLHGLHIPPAVDAPEKLVGDGETLAHEFGLLPGSAGTYGYHPTRTGGSPSSCSAAWPGP